MSSESMMNRIAPGWVRPFSSGYACHTALFFSYEVLLWSHVCMAPQFNEQRKFEILFWSNWISLLVLAVGVAWSIPYLRSTFQMMEIVVEDGPSLITELIPQYLFVGVMAAVVIIVGISDYLILEHQTIPLTSISVLAFLGVVGLEFAINSKIDYPQRVLIASTLLSLSLACPTSLNDSNIVNLVGLALLISSLLDALLIKQNPDIMVSMETFSLRLRMVVKIFLALSIAIQRLCGLSIPLILFCVGCDVILYIQERRWGTFTERIYRKYVPPNSFTEA